MMTTNKKVLTEAQVLNSPFNAEVHKNTFTNYLEVVIYPGGQVEYAVPSHQLKMFIIAYRNHTGQNLKHYDDNFVEKRIEFESKIPREYWLDMIEYYANLTGVVCVWNTHVIAPKLGATFEQVKKLEMLKEMGLYKGNIPEIRKN